MKIFISLVIASVFSLNVQAKQMPLFPELEEQDAMAAVEEFCQIDGLECSIESYDVQSFDAQKALSEINAKIQDPESAWVYEVDTHIKSVVDHVYFDHAGAKGLFNYFVKNNKIKAAYGFYPNEDQCTQSEYCSVYSAYIYLTNGKVVVVHFDFNT